ncbi:MAG: ribosome biogenesis GTPase Der [bacterium]
MTKNLPRVLLVGKTNVGKSSLFNRISQSPKEKTAIVSSFPGTTRDVLERKCSWNGTDFLIQDAGGFFPDSEEQMEQEVTDQVKEYINQSHLILFVIDSLDGITSADLIIASWLRKIKQPKILVANKVEKADVRNQSSEFSTLGFGEPYLTSAVTGSGVGDLLDQITTILKTSYFKPQVEAKDIVRPIRIALIGKQNVGKSSLLNTFTGKNRSLVSTIAGTTRDSVSFFITIGDKKVELIDTAGLRRHSKVGLWLDKISMRHTERTIRMSDMVLFIFDSQEYYTTRQDRRISRMIAKARKPCLLVINKWDLIEDRAKLEKILRKYYAVQFKNIFSPFLVFTSAIQKQGIEKVYDSILYIYDKLNTTIPNEELQKLLEDVLQYHPAPEIKGKHLRLRTLKQLDTNPPTFRLKYSGSKDFPEKYLQHLKNRLIAEYDFKGIPIRLLTFAK